MVSFEQWQEKRSRIHKERMLETTRRDLELSKHLYADYIPHTMMSWGMRQDVDLFELNFQWQFTVGMLVGVPLTRLTHGYSMTRQRFFKSSLKFGVFNALISIPYTYFLCPMAQEPNRGTLQFIGWEQGFKNYMDKKYDLYKDSELDFYDTLTQQERKKELTKIRYELMTERVNEFNDTFKNMISK